VLVVGGRQAVRVVDALVDLEVDASAASLPFGTVDAQAIVLMPIDVVPAASLGSDDGWEERCEGLLLQGLHVAQAARELLVHGGRLVFVLPDVGITGAAEQVPLATAVEGLRALAKSAGRQWAEDGITTATILVPTRADAVSAGAVADVVGALVGPAGGLLNGVTLPIDSGLMVP
jgi:3-oxoacyl-[acyl-carrier protein] reductase